MILDSYKPILHGETPCACPWQFCESFTYRSDGRSTMLTMCYVRRDTNAIHPPKVLQKLRQDRDAFMHLYTPAERAWMTMRQRCRQTGSLRKGVKTCVKRN